MTNQPNAQPAKPEQADDKNKQQNAPEKNNSNQDDAKKNNPAEVTGFAAIKAKEEAVKAGNTKA